MEKLKYDLAMAAATAKAQAKLTKRPSLKVSQAIAAHFVTAYKEFSTEEGEKFLETAIRILKE